MRCFLCKRDIQKAVRVFLDARNNREKSRFRDLCENCYHEHMTQQGFVLQKGEAGGLDMWVKP